MESSDENECRHLSSGHNEGGLSKTTESNPLINHAEENGTQKMKKRAIVASDSDEEGINNMQIDEITVQTEENDQTTTTMPSLGDSEDEKELNDNESAKKKKTFKLIDSDSESGEETVDCAESETDEAPIYTVNDKKELVPEKNISDGLAALCDPDTSDDEDKTVQPLVYKKKTKKKGEEAEEKPMSVKDAAEQRREIESVSQRMMREKHVALPYHKPKQRSLKEFLQNRPKFASSVPEAVSKVPAAIAIKMSKEQLDIVSKRIEEREKQVEEFYKSDSEEEEEIVEEMDTSKDAEIDAEILQSEISDESARRLCQENENFDTIDGKSPEIQNINKPTLSEETKAEHPENVAENKSTNPSKFNISDTEENVLESSTECNATKHSLLHDEDQNNDGMIAEKQVAAKPSALQILKEQLGNTQPKLSGAPNYVIDLDDGTTHLDEVTQLMQRFSKHTSKKPIQKKSSAVELDILYVSQGGEIHKEKVAVKVADHEEPAIEEKPGLKYKQLKNDLQTQMALRRNAVWKEKQAKLQAEKEANEEYDVYKGEKDDCGIDDLLDDEEEEFSNAGSDEDEDDGEENDEAHNDDGMIDNEADADESGENDVENQEGEEEIEVKPMPKPKKMIKQLRRIVQPVDSDSEEENDCNKSGNQSKQMDSTVSWPDDDDFISAGQTNSCRTPIKQACMQTKSDLEFLSPVCRLTGLQSFDATGKFLQNSPGSPAVKLGEASPLAKSSNAWSKSLFNDSPCKTQNLEEICSGTFTTQFATQPSEDRTDVTDENTEKQAGNVGCEVKSPNVNTQDMLELCSGNFEFTQPQGVTEETIVQVRKNNDMESNITALSNDIIEEELGIIDKKESNNQEAVIDEDDDRLISQLIDEDELETFKKKFESPLQDTYNTPQADERIATKIAFDAMNQVDNDENSDDDEDDDHMNFNTQKRRKKNKLIDSDDEDDIQDDGDIDLQDDVNDLNEDDEDNDEIDGNEEDGLNEDDNNEDQDNNGETEFGYDSEENEILIEKHVKPKKMKLKDFLENEAELSESEWGSEDEDERNLDVMEMEEGDKEQFDEEKLKDDLEKIHMKRILDEDRKSLKVLQELYLDEDEELKGAGRQRQFRWKNIDTVDNQKEESSNHEEVITTHEDEGENEEVWRKKRYERELFLQSQKSKTDDDEDSSMALKATNSQLFKLGQRAVIRNKQMVKISSEFTAKKSFTFNTQRGSFLSRKDEVLTRVAEYTKVADVVLGAPKNSRNFVFQSISKDAGTSTSLEDKKRKAADSGTPVQLKRLRLNGFSPADQKKKAEARSKQRLFTNKQW